MPLRNVRNFSRYLRQTLSAQTMVKKELKRRHGWTDEDLILLLRPVSKAKKIRKSISKPGLKNSVKDAVRERRKIIQKIIINTVLQNAGAKTLSPEKYASTKKAITKLYDLIAVRVRVETAFIQSFGKTLPTDLKRIIEDYEKQKINPVTYMLVNICGAEMTIRILKELNDLMAIVRDTKGFSITDAL